MSILYDPRFDRLEHVGVKGMRWGHRKRQEQSRRQTSSTLSPEQLAAVNRRRMELRKKAAANEGKGTGLPKTAAPGGASGESAEGSGTSEEESEEEGKEKKGKAKAAKAKPNNEAKKLREEAKKNAEKIALLEKKLMDLEKQIANDKQLAKREKTVRGMLEGNTSFSFVGSRQGAYKDAASSGVLGELLRKEQG